MAGDRITANLPSRDFDQTEAFYGLLGFERMYRDTGWMIVKRGGMEVEFFPHPDLKPEDSWFSACIRVDDYDGLLATWKALDLPADPMGRPRSFPDVPAPDGLRIFALIDCDGSLLRCIDNRSP